MNFETIHKNVREMSLRQAEERFQMANHAEVLTSFERGAIIHHAAGTWFPEDKPGFQSWILNSLRIPLEVAGRYQRVFQAILHSGIKEEQVRGIPMSSLLMMVTVLRNSAHKEHLEEILEVARTSSVAELKRRVYAIRGIQVPLNSKEAKVVVRMSDWGKTIEFLGTVGAALAEKGILYSIVCYDSNTKKGHTINNCFEKGEPGHPSKVLEAMKKKAAKVKASQATEPDETEDDPANDEFSVLTTEGPTVVEYAEGVKQRELEAPMPEA